MNTEDTNKILNWIKEEREKITSLENMVTKEVESICKNCKYWSYNKNINKKQFSDCDGFNSSVSDGKVDIELHALDDSGLYSVVYTHESFGCNLFQSE